MYEQPQWGNVNLGVDVLQGHGEQSQPGKADYDRNHPRAKEKQQYNPGRNQELKLPPESFRMIKGTRENPNSPTGKMIPLKTTHERIKELLGEGWPRNYAVQKARSESEFQGRGDIGTVTPKQVYQHKYQAEQPSKKVSPFSEQVQGYPFI